MRNSMIVMAAPAVFLLAACGSSSDDDGVRGGDYEQTYNAGGDTTATVTAGGEIEVDLPLGFETYPGSRVVSNLKVNNPGVKGNTVVMETDDGVQEAADFYRAQARSSGIEINLENVSPDATMLAGRQEGQSGFNMIAARNDEGKTTISLTISEANE